MNFVNFVPGTRAAIAALMLNDNALEVRFWGVRGSLPSPGNETALVGGNTSCVEVTCAGTRIVLDAGSGIRALGDMLVERAEHREVSLLLSHAHWDHVMGLPFFAPLYRAESHVTVMCGPLGSNACIRDVLRAQMAQPLFPVSFDAVGARVETVDLQAGTRFRIGTLAVTTLLLTHPDPVVAYRIDSWGGRSIVYATDTEHVEGRIDEQLVKLSRGADVLIYDAQYTPEEYRGEDGPSRRGWGHSTFEAGAAIARAAHVRTLALFHHDPKRTDEAVADIVKRARLSFPSTVAAREGQSIRLEHDQPARTEQAL